MQRRHTLFTAPLVAVFLAGGCRGRAFSQEAEPEAPPPAAPRPDEALPASEPPQVLFATVTVDVEVAATDAARARGLGGHAPLGEREGMLFVFEQPGPHAFWMKGMTFPLDMMWIEGGQVVHLVQNVPHVPPGTPDSSLPIYASPVPARYVLEVNAGFAALHGIEVGTPLEMRGVPDSATRAVG